MSQYTEPMAIAAEVPHISGAAGLSAVMEYALELASIPCMQ